MAVADILITPATVWRAPVAEALPDETTITYGLAWGGNWTDLGYTLQPLAMNYNQDIFELFVEQSTLPVKRRKVQETAVFETVLAESTSTNIAVGVDGTVTTTAAGASQRGFYDVDAGGDTTLSEYAWGFEGLYEDSSGNQFPVRLFIYKGTAVLNGPLTFAKNEATGIPLQITAMADTSKSAGAQLFKFQKVTAEATS